MCSTVSLPALQCGHSRCSRGTPCQQPDSSAPQGERVRHCASASRRHRSRTCVMNPLAWPSWRHRACRRARKHIMLQPGGASQDAAVCSMSSCRCQYASRNAALPTGRGAAKSSCTPTAASGAASCCARAGVRAGGSRGPARAPRWLSPSAAADCPALLPAHGSTAVLLASPSAAMSASACSVPPAPLRTRPTWFSTAPSTATCVFEYADLFSPDLPPSIPSFFFPKPDYSCGIRPWLPRCMPPQCVYESCWLRIRCKSSQIKQ